MEVQDAGPQIVVMRAPMQYLKLRKFIETTRWTVSRMFVFAGLALTIIWAGFIVYGVVSLVLKSGGTGNDGGTRAERILSLFQSVP